MFLWTNFLCFYGEIRKLIPEILPNTLNKTAMTETNVKSPLVIFYENGPLITTEFTLKIQTNMPEQTV